MLVIAAISVSRRLYLELGLRLHAMTFRLMAAWSEMKGPCSLIFDIKCTREENALITRR